MIQPYIKFNYDLNWASINTRVNPEYYRIGRGEQGVLLVEPYKSELLPYWRFKTPTIAKESSSILYKKFIEYLDNNDFIGADMCRKFIQMGYTRSRRYANHKSGKKYIGPVPKDKRGQSGSHGRDTLPNDIDEEKAQSAEIFKQVWVKARTNKKYLLLKKEFRKKYYPK